MLCVAILYSFFGSRLAKCPLFNEQDCALTSTTTMHFTKRTNQCNLGLLLPALRFRRIHQMQSGHFPQADVTCTPAEDDVRNEACGPCAMTCAGAGDTLLYNTDAGTQIVMRSLQAPQNLPSWHYSEHDSLASTL